MTIFNQIINWNNERGLIDKVYSHENEVSFILEELIESIIQSESKEVRPLAQEIASEFMQILGTPSTKVQKVDAFADIIVFACGAIAKLGYEPDKVMQEVLNELNDRTGSLIEGKFVKDIKEDPYKANFDVCKIL